MGKTHIVQSYGQIPIHFETNLGQTDEQVKFISRGSGYTLFLTSNETVLSLRRPETGDRRLKKESEIDYELSSNSQSAIRNPKSTILRMQLVNANPEPKVEGLGELITKTNYFIGKDRDKWRTNVPNYAKVKVRDVYPGIDLVYYGNQEKLEYDFVVAPGVDPDAITMSWEGADDLSVDDRGNLVLLDDGGCVTLRAPIIYQDINGSKRPISGQYVLKSYHEIGFEINAYETDYPLVIDPVLVYSTFLGGSHTDSGEDVAVDAEGNAYITGMTSSDDFPIENPYQPGSRGQDAFVLKLNTSGTSIVYATYLGGDKQESGQGIAVDAQGNAYVMGWTSSDNFPTANAVQGALALNNRGIGRDAFVTKLNAAGSGLFYSTYLGGSDNELEEWMNAGGIAVDAQGNAYITGATHSYDFPVANAFQSSYNGLSDVFVSKLSSSGGLVYSSYYGGTDFDSGNDIAVDAQGNAYVTGRFDSFFSHLVLLLKVNATGSLDRTMTLGDNHSMGSGIALDSLGNIYLTGFTRDDDFPTVNPLQEYGGGYSDAFVTKLSPGFTIVYSTYLGGYAVDNYSELGDPEGDIAVDNDGNAYVTGNTISGNFPTVDAVQNYYGGEYDYNLPMGDAFVAKLHPSGSSLIFSTFLGGSDDEIGSGIAVDPEGNIYVTGLTRSNNFPTANALKNEKGLYQDAFVAKIEVDETLEEPEVPDEVQITQLTPPGTDPLTAWTTVPIKVQVGYDLNTDSTGQIELMITDAMGGIMVSPAAVEVTNQSESVEIDATMRIRNVSDAVMIKAILTSDAGYETISDPMRYYINRIRFQFVTPLPAEWLKRDEETPFDAKLEYYLANETEDGRVYLDLQDDTGQLILPPEDVTSNKLTDLSTGGRIVELQTRITIPEEGKQILLIARLLDGATVLTSDTVTYRINMEKGRVTILNSNPPIPLYLVEVTATNQGGEVVNTQLTDLDGEYQLYLDPGQYTITAKPEELDQYIRVEKSIPFTVDENTEKAPDIEMGVVNRQTKTFSIANTMTNYANTGIVGWVDPNIPFKPFADEMAEVIQFALSQPDPPDETDERLYRLHLAMFALEQISVSTSDASSGLGGLLAELIYDHSILSKWKEKLQGIVTKFLQNPGNFILNNKYISFDRIRNLMGRAGDKLGRLLGRLSDAIKNYMSAAIGPRTTGGQRIKRAFEIFFGQMSTEKSYFSILANTPFYADSTIKKLMGRAIGTGLAAWQGEYFTSPSVRAAVETAKTFSPPNDELRFDRDGVNIDVSASNNRSHEMTMTMSSHTYIIDIAAAIRTGINSVNAALIPFVGFPATTAVAYPIYTFFRGLSKCITPLIYAIKAWDGAGLIARLFYQLPSELDGAMAQAFHKSTLADLPVESAMNKSSPDDESPYCSISDGVLGALSQVSSDYNDHLQTMLDRIENDDFDALVTHVTDNVFQADDDLEAALRAAEGPILSAAAVTMAMDEDFGESYSAMTDSAVALITKRMMLYTNVFSFIMEAANVDSMDDPDYLLRKDEVRSAIRHVMDSNTQMDAQLQDVANRVNVYGTALPTVVIEGMKLSSQGSPLSSIQSSPQDIRVTATVANASDVGISDLTATLADFSPDFGMTFQSVQTIDIPNLNGLEKMDLEWELLFSGSLSLESIPVCLTLSTDTNDVFTPAPFVVLVSVVDTLDTDGDGMPDSYEEANDLNAASKDMDGDGDADDLINLSEYMLGTDPQDADTDDDGFTDGDEVNRGSDPKDPEETPDSVIPSVQAQLGTYTAEAGGEFTLPVSLGDLWDHDVYSTDIRLAYNPDVLTAKGASNGEIAADQNWSINSDIKGDGQIWIAMAGVTPLSSGGILVNVEFDVVGSPGDSTSIRFLELTLNEGIPSARMEDGILWVYDPSDVEQEMSQLPDTFTLFQNYPNPFNPVTTIGYTIPSGASGQAVQLEVFNLNGEKVNTLVNQMQTAGHYRVQWNGKNQFGESVPSGIYVYKLQMGVQVQVRKMMFLK